MATLLRGEIRWADIEPVSQVVGHEQGGRRPVLTLSRDRFNESTQLVVVALITSSGPNGPGAVLIQSVQMPQQSWVLAGQVRTLSVERIKELIGRMAEDEMEDVLRAVFLIIAPGA